MKKETTGNETLRSHQQETTAGTINLPVAQRPAPSEAPDGGERGVLDQVRDLLFGDQARATDTRLQALETRMAAHMAEMRTETLDRIEALSQGMGERMDKIEERLSSQDTEWHNANQDMTKRIEEIRSDLSQQLLKESKDLGERITDGQQKTMAYVDRTAGALKKGKTDRDALARLFSQMASRLEGEENEP